MAKTQNKKPAIRQAPVNKASVASETKNKFSFKLEIPSLPGLTPYLPGLLLFFITLIIALLTYKDYGISWDEPTQRLEGLLSYNYIFHGDPGLFDPKINHVEGMVSLNSHGTGFELLLVMIEKMLNLSDSRDIYLMRHLATHIFFLISVFAGYILAYRLFKNKFIACLGFIMLAFGPRIYAHSFYNTKDIPFLCMFTITFACSQIAFEKEKPWLFFILGICCGYATSIRIMGVMLFLFIIIFLLIDLLSKIISKSEIKKNIYNGSLFLAGFLLFLYLGWPYLWKDPIKNLIDSFVVFSHFNVDFDIVFMGRGYNITKLPWYYLPTWFLISNPEAWLIAGFGGVVWLGVFFFKKPLSFFKNTWERNFLLYLMCFFIPIFSVIFLHSVVYNDWRHLYFVYPAFVLLALYFIDRLYESKYRLIVQSVCILQIGLIGFFLIVNHPFGQIYFNNFISHGPQYLLSKFDLEYWGCSYKQGLEYLLNTDNSKTIKVNCMYKILLDNNILILPEEDRNRIVYADKENADYIIPVWTRTNIQGDYFSTKVDSIKVLNSNIFCIFKVEKDPAKRMLMVTDKINSLIKIIANNPDDKNTQWEIGNAYLIVGQYDSADVHFKKYFQLAPANLDAMHSLTEAYMNLRKYPQAIEFLQKIIALKPDDENAQMRIGAAFYLSAQYDSSEVHDKRAMELNPKNSYAINNLAGVYLFQKKYPQAIGLYKDVISLRPDYVDPYTNIAACYLNSGKLDSGIHFLYQAVSIDPGNSRSYEFLSRVYKSMGKEDSARKYEARVQKNNPGFKL